VCGEELFESKSKYASGSGWPRFSAPVDGNAMASERGGSHGMIRDEVPFANCGAHLGHVFADVPKPIGSRYCINSALLAFKAGDGE
jgi:peptide-methionine (R)-S-oxide reductase